MPYIKLAGSDIVSIHLRLSEGSRGLLNRKRLAKMKPDALLINTARGAIVDEDALVEALKENRLAGAGLDVFAVEPLPVSSPLRTLPNVLLTPHIGWKGILCVSEPLWDLFLLRENGCCGCFIRFNKFFIIIPDHPDQVSIFINPV
jgi:hypothetical protein